MTAPRYALVTGASRGIGKHFARALAARGWNLILTARSQSLLDQFAQELRTASPVDIQTIPADLTIPGASSEISRQISDRRLPVDLLVNNAGHGDRGRFLDLTLEEQISSIRLNVLALVELTHLMVPAMIARGRGSIINVSSTAGFQPMPYSAAYSATKAFVTNFSMAIAEELRSSGITVVTLCPGPTETESSAGREPRAKVPGGRQPADEVVAEALSRIEGQGGLVVPRLINKVMAFSNRLMPVQWSAKIIAKASSGQKR